MIEPLTLWDIKYFHFALECDVPILEALYLMNQGDQEFILYQAQNQIVDVVKVIENDDNYMHTLCQTYPPLGKQTDKFQLSKYTCVQINNEVLERIARLHLHFVTKLENNFFMITFFSFTFSKQGFWTMDDGDVNLIIGNIWAVPQFQKIKQSNTWLADRISKAQSKMLSNYDLTSPGCRRIRTSFVDLTESSDFEKILKTSCSLYDMSLSEPI